MPISVQLLLIFVMAVFANAKVYFNRRAEIDNMAFALKFNAIVFGTVGCVFLVFLLSKPLSNFTLLLGVIYGAASIIFQVFYVMALQKGPVSIVVLLANLAAVPAALGGALLFGEGLRITQLIGLILTAASMLLTMKRGDSKKDNKGYFYGVLAMLASSVALLIQRYHQKTEFALERNGFLCVAYLSAAIMTAAVLLFTGRRRKKNENKKFAWLGIGAGAALAVYQFLMIFLAGKTAAMLMYPAILCFTTILNVIMCVAVFKEKISKRQAIGLALGTVAIVIMSI